MIKTGLTTQSQLAHDKTFLCKNCKGLKVPKNRFTSPYMITGAKVKV